MIDIRQSTFAGGEVTPVLNGRVDLAKYLNSLGRSRNGFATRHGSWMNRSGTRYIAEVKNSAKKVRLVPFNFAAGQNFILEFGDLYIRFYKDGGQVLSAGVPYEVVTPYVEADLPKLKFAQVGDIITITHSSYAPRELRRYSNTNWQLAAITFVSPAFNISTVGGVAKAADASLVYDRSAAVTLTKKPVAYCLTMMLRSTSDKRVIESLAFNFGVVNQGGGALAPGAQVVDSTETAWSSGGVAYVIGNIVKGSDNALYYCRQNHNSSPASDPTLSARWLLPGGEWRPIVAGLVDPASPSIEDAIYIGMTMSLPEQKPKLYWSGASAPAGYDLLGFRLYRGMEGVFGLLADVAGDVKQFLDDGSHESDYTRSPPSSENPFATDYPAVAGFFEQRRVMANTPLRPADVIASKVGDYNNFGWKPLVVDDDAISGVTLASQSFEEIRWMLPLRALLLGTNEGAWVLGGAGGVDSAMTAMSAKARKQVARPFAWLDPIGIDNAAIALQEYGGFVREILYDYSTDSYHNNDLSVMAEHLFEGLSITSWAYAQHPFGIVWAVRSDGVMLGLTYSREHEVAAWHWHDTDGEFEGVATIAEGSENAVYVVVNRTINGATKRYVEKFVSRILPKTNGSPDVKKGVFLDSSLTYDGVAATVFSGLDHLEGESVTVLADGCVLGPYTVSAGQIDIINEMPDGAAYVTVGLGYVSQLETLDLVANGTDLKSRFKRILKVLFEAVDSRGMKFGSDYDNLKEWRQRTVAMGYGVIPVETKMVAVSVPSSFTRTGRAVMQQDDPLPVTLISITREVELGDD